jgi:hypothetical protein
MQIRKSESKKFSILCTFKSQKFYYFRRPEGVGGGGGEDGMPLVETVSPGNGAVCRAGSCTEDPQVHFLISRPHKTPFKS